MVEELGFALKGVTSLYNILWIPVFEKFDEFQSLHFQDIKE